MASPDLPAPVEPMLASPDDGHLPDAPHLVYEFKWDGYRAIMRCAPDGTTVLTSRNSKDFTVRFPELTDSPLAEALDGRAAVLDGEIVVPDQHGRPDFGALQNHRASDRPARFFAFDVLQLGEVRLLTTPFTRRRALLAGLEPGSDSPVVITPAYSHADLAASGLSPHDLLGIAAQQGLEGLVAKAATSLYYPGRRSREWLKHPLIQTTEVVLAGWRAGEGRRAGLLGALLLGAHVPDTGLVYLGDVGTGFSDRALEELRDLLAPLHQDYSPFAMPVPRDRARGVQWVRPELVGEVVFRQFTGEGRLRHAAWRGLRPDRDPATIVVPTNAG